MNPFYDDIKQAVREALREELPRMLRERVIPVEERAPRPGVDEFLTVAQAASMAGYNEQTIRAKLRDKDLKGVRPGGGRSWRVRTSVLIAWLNAQKECVAEVIDINAEADRMLLRLNR